MHDEMYFVEEMTDGTYVLCHGPRDYDYMDSMRDITSDDQVAVIVKDGLTRDEAQRLLAAAERGELDQ